MEKIEIGAEKELFNIIEKGKLINKKIFFMGNIYNIYPLLKVLADFKLSMTAIVDNDETKAGIHTFNSEKYEIIKTKDFFQQNPEKVVLFIFSERFWCEMMEQMVRKGYTEGNNLFVLNGVTYQKKLRYIEKGYKLVQKYQKKYGEDVFILLFYGPVGDNYLFSLFLRQYLKKRNIENYTCAGTNATRKICNIFGFPKFELLNREEIVALEYLYMFLGENESRIKVLQIWDWPFHINRDRIRFDKRFNFIDTFRNYVFCLDNTEIPEIPCFCSNKEIIKEVFLEKGLEEKNTIILAPYTYSIPNYIPKEFWIDLARRLREYGGKVAVNIDPSPMHRDKEQNYIVNTQTLSFELQDSVSYLEYAGFFIGMRSGLCDVISSAKCKKIILYPHIKRIDYDRHRQDKEFSSLKTMGLTNEVEELEFDVEGNLEYWYKQAEQIALNVYMNGIESIVYEHN